MHAHSGGLRSLFLTWTSGIQLMSSGLHGNNFCLLSHLTGPLCFYEAWLLPCTLEKHEKNIEISCGLGFPTDLNFISSNSVVGCQSFLHFLPENVLDADKAVCLFVLLTRAACTATPSRFHLAIVSSAVTLLVVSTYPPAVNRFLFWALQSRLCLMICLQPAFSY